MSKKSRQDLLVRVRYLNPLPAPPFPPKLFEIPTDIRRLGEPSYLSQLATSAPLPMLVDAEMGMPLDLNQFDGVWEGEDSALNPTAGPAEIDPEDAILLTPATTEEAKPSGVEVSWMRSGNLFMRKMGGKKGEAKPVVQAADIDTSAVAQIMAIDATFADISKDIRHPDPAKRNLRVAEVYDILPDEDSWGTDMVAVRFPERPTAVAPALRTAERPSSAVLGNSFIRGFKAANDSMIMEFYMPEDEDPAKLRSLQPVTEEQQEQFEEAAQRGYEEAAEVIPTASFRRKRLYEVLNNRIRKDDERIEEVLVSMQEGGARYRTIRAKMTVRKMRAMKQEEMAMQSHWDKVILGRRGYTSAEARASADARRRVVDPAWTAGEVEMGETIEEDMNE